MRAGAPAASGQAAHRRRLGAASGGAGFDVGIKVVVGLVILGLMIFTGGQFLSAAQSDNPVPSDWGDSGFGGDGTDDFVDEDLDDEDVDGSDEEPAEDEDLDDWGLDDESTDDGSDDDER